MKKWLLILLFIHSPLITYGQQRAIVVDIEGMIDNGITKYVERSLALAEENSDITYVIFHIDTFGGLVDAADQIRKAILESNKITVAYIDKNAASAGALISLACDSIYMAPGSSMGAATVVTGGGGDKASEKMQSYMRGLMRATAEENGRNPRIAEAMVDESIEIEGITDAGKLITLSTKEAEELGISDGHFYTIEDVYENLGLSVNNVLVIQERKAESILRFLSSPVVSSILMLMMLGGLYFELQTPGVGFAGGISALGAFLFFAPLYIIGLAESWEIVLFIIGIILIVIEIFIIPGFGLAGISGITLMIFSLGAALVGNIGFNFPELSQMAGAIWTLTTTLLIGIALVISLARYLPANEYFSRLVLTDSTDRESGYISSTPQDDLVGLKGKAITPLRPSGIILIDNKKISVVSDGVFIDSGDEIIVVSSAGGRVVVTKDV